MKSIRGEMKVKILKPIRVYVIEGEVEVTEQECNRLMLLNAAVPVIAKKTEKAKKETKIVEEK